MQNAWKITVAVLFLLLLIAGCVPNVPAGGMSNPLLPVIDTNGSVSLPASGTPAFKYGQDAQWPAYIPQEIPALEGKISTVMEAADSHIRIFYEELNSTQREAYLNQLEQQGYQLEYIIYVQEGSPDNSEKRRKQGDFDAVDITNGQYHMRLEYGENSATYDIYTSGFEATVVSALGLLWPAELVGGVPQPERCLLETVEPLPPQVTRISCAIADDDVLADYQQALIDSGFIAGEIIQTAEGQVVLASYTLDNITVSLDLGMSAHMTVEVAINNETIKTTWPETLEGILPAPPRCEITDILPTGASNLVISCEANDAQVVTEYMAKLFAAGFIETNRMESPNGDLISANFDNGELHVQLLMGTTTSLSINIRGLP